jgi:putative GTP pyrophosphokinase
MAPVSIDKLLRTVNERRHEFEIYLGAVTEFFLKHPSLMTGDFPSIHSVRSRVKAESHLRDKLVRKRKEGREITEKNIFKEVTDIAGVRVLHLHQDQLAQIHLAIMKRVESRDWVLAEKPKAYTWDPEAIQFMKTLGLSVNHKVSFYTSVHYVVRPRKDADISCEIQVRTLFEEIWGEIDHKINYPEATLSTACKEQLLVLAKVVGAGSRLVDAVFRTHEHEAKQVERKL